MQGETLPPVMNMPGAEGTQARHWTEAAAEGKQKDVMQTRASLSTSRIPLWRFETVRETEYVCTQSTAKDKATTSVLNESPSLKKAEARTTGLIGFLVSTSPPAF